MRFSRYMPLIAAATLALGTVASAMFIRHDVPDSAYLDRAKAAEFDCVGRLDKGSERTGSCVLVSPKWALTDAHVVYAVKPEMITAQFGSIKVKVKVKRFVIHPDYQSEKYKSEATALGKKGIDIALIELADEVTAVKPAQIAENPIKVGEMMTCVGFGVTGKGNKLEPTVEADPQKRAGTNIVDSIGGDIEGKIPDWLYVTDFDGPDGIGKNRCGDSKPTSLECLGAGGDSGGGAFAEIDGKWQLVALFSTTRYMDIEDKDAKAYGDVSMYTRLDRFRNWVLETAH